MAKKKRKKKGRETDPATEHWTESLSESPGPCQCYVTLPKFGNPCGHCLEVVVLTAEIICSDAAAGRHQKGK